MAGNGVKRVCVDYLKGQVSFKDNELPDDLENGSGERFEPRMKEQSDEGVTRREPLSAGRWRRSGPLRCRERHVVTI